MIQYALICDEGHQVDSWFQSASAFQTLSDAGHLSCAVCGSAEVRKAVMAPRVATRQAETSQTPRSLSKTSTEEEKALQALRKHVEQNADYVGREFAAEARAMYLGAAPDRAIYGEVNRADAKALIEDGVPVAPLPFVPNRKTN
ncbi:DUF1178 family protein [Roseobacter weihaiensis]|uniref:DUF1178 family protein n=1 Tax=Roseobacter weihaiensis TaxID=2763262 RepID=UPI001D09C468|nr:DUF1178 family protein [Roseobacter sp. H9]